MLTEPEIIDRPAQPYVAIKAHVTMQTIGAVLPELHPHVFAWLGQRGIPPAGPPFWKYNVVDMERQMEVEVGVPIGAAADGDDRVLAGTLPSGRYASLQHTGHPDQLFDATRALLDWAAERGLSFDVAPDPEGDRWAARLELYQTDPAVEPDMNKWTTQLAFRLAD
jgi:effector-binding domain-containing protein